MPRTRRHFSPQDKVRILKRHLVENEPVSAICDSEQISPTLFYQWQKMFFENGAAAFAREDQRAQQRQAEEVAKLRSRLQQKDEVIAQIAEEHIQLKKELGEL